MVQITQNYYIIYMILQVKSTCHMLHRGSGRFCGKGYSGIYGLHVEPCRHVHVFSFQKFSEMHNLFMLLN